MTLDAFTKARSTMTKIEVLKEAIRRIDDMLAQKEVNGLKSQVEEPGMYGFFMSYGIGYDYKPDAVDLSGMQIAHDILRFARSRIVKEIETLDELVKSL